jgi:hypothetical protein
LLKEDMSTTITLDDDVALVLFELLASERLESGLEAPERNALWALEGHLEKTLVEPFAPNYRELLDRARKSLVERGGP